MVSPAGRKIKLAVRSHRDSVRGEQVIAFLKQLLRIIPGEIVLVWDNHPIHKRHLVQQFIHAQLRLHVYWFPICAPELNPVEFVWAQISQHTAGFAPYNMSQLYTRVQAGIARTRNSRKRLLACWAATRLSWF